MDLLSIALNEEYNKKGIYSHVTCPGLSMTNITNSILPNWFWAMFRPFLLMVSGTFIGYNCVLRFQVNANPLYAGWDFDVVMEEARKAKIIGQAS